MTRPKIASGVVALVLPNSVEELCPGCGRGTNWPFACPRCGTACPSGCFSTVLGAVAVPVVAVVLGLLRSQRR